MKKIFYFFTVVLVIGWVLSIIVGLFAVFMYSPSALIYTLVISAIAALLFGVIRSGSDA